MTCIIMSDMKSVIDKSFRDFLLYNNHKYGRFHDSYLDHAVLNLLK